MNNLKVHLQGILLRAMCRQINWPSQFDHLERSFSFKEVLFKKHYLPVKINCPSAENVHESPAFVTAIIIITYCLYMEII